MLIDPPKFRAYQGAALRDQDVLDDIAKRQRMRAIPREWLVDLEAQLEREAIEERARHRAETLRRTAWGVLVALSLCAAWALTRAGW